MCHHIGEDDRTTQDPLGFYAGDTNLYRYLHNSPEDATDPSGYFAKTGYLEWDSNAYGIPGTKHLALRVDEACTKKITVFELLGYNQHTLPNATRVGYGPFGPYGYFKFGLAALQTGWFKPNVPNLKTWTTVLGIALPLFNGFAETYWPGSLDKAYGLYIASADQTIPRSGKVKLPEAITDRQLQGLINSTKDLGKEASTKSFDITITAFGFSVKKSVPVGLGYDISFRNSNTFIGTIMRANGLQAPSEVTASAWGFDKTFNAWTYWDRLLQPYFQQMANIG